MSNLGLLILIIVVIIVAIIVIAGMNRDKGQGPPRRH